MNTPVKYLFDNKFDELEEEEVEPIEDVIKRNLREEFDKELEEEKKKSHEQGVTEGYNKAQEEIDKSILESNKIQKKSYEELSAIVLKLVEKIESEKNKFEDKAKEYSSEAIQLGMVIAKKLAEESISSLPLASLEAVFERNINKIPVEQKVFVSIPGNLKEHTEKVLNDISKERMTELQIIVQENKEMHEGDWSFEWNTGGIARNTEAVSKEITDIVNKYIQLQTSTIEQNEEIKNSPPGEEIQTNSGQTASSKETESTA